MFDTFNAINSELSGPSLQPVPISTQERLKVIEATVNKLYQSAVPGSKKHINVITDPTSYHFGSFAARNSHTVQIPLVSLIRSDEIPDQFKITNLDDPRLNNTIFMQDYSNWIYNKLGMPKGQCLVNKTVLKSNALFFQNRQNAIDGTKFALMHELGHVHNDFGIMMNLVQHGRSILGFLAPIGAVVAFFVLVPLSIPVLVALIPLSITLVVIAGYVNTVGLSILAQRCYILPNEWRADNFAAKHCPESLGGGIHLFKIMQENNKMEAATDKLSELAEITDKLSELAEILETCKDTFLVSYIHKATKWIKERLAEGENPLDLAHPLIKDRIAHLESLQMQNRSRPVSQLNLASAGI